MVISIALIPNKIYIEFLVLGINLWNISSIWGKENRMNKIPTKIASFPSDNMVLIMLLFCSVKRLLTRCISLTDGGF
jgi:hypothetical protein